MYFAHSTGNFLMELHRNQNEKWEGITAKDWSSERNPNKKGVADFYQGRKLLELHSHGR